MKTKYFGTESLSFTGFKIMRFFTSGLENIIVTNAAQITNKNKGSAKLPIPNLQGIHAECQFYLI